MPELPEVETVRRGLEPVMAGARFERVEQRRPDLRFPFPERFVERVQGKTLTHLGRRAKYLMARLDSGEMLVMHLGMSGRFSIIPPSPRARGEGHPLAPHLESSPHPDPLPLQSMERGDRALLASFTYDTGNDPAHDHAVFHMSSGATVVYNDPRRFGYMQLVPETDLPEHALFKGLGVEPLGNELTAAHLAQRAAGRSVDLKAFLLDQRNIAGLGNIYVCEALHRAGLSPNRAASVLADRKGRPTERTERLVPIIRAVLEEAIEAGGSTLRDYKHADGSLGYFQHSFKVYGREGEPCTREACGGTVKRIVQSGRSTFYCGKCQR
jgi:formamidopyrimidine-DNA glycosylase